MNKNFNGSAISPQLFAYIRETLPAGSTILEIGSGTGTIELCKHYTVFSVEHDPRWLNMAASNYIHAPIVNGWYDVDVLKSKLPSDYDLLLVDGPPGKIGRQKFFNHLHLFRWDVPFIFDDTHRQPEQQLALLTAKVVGKQPVEFHSQQKSFIVLK